MVALRIPTLDSLNFDTPLPKGWQGARDHIGPVQTVTPLVDRLSGKTTCATVSLLAGVVSWGERRLRAHCDVEFLRELSAAMFAWQHDWRLVNTEVAPRGKPPDQPIEASAPMVFRSFVRKSIRGEDPWHSFYQPIMQLYHLVKVTEFLLPDADRSTFQTWLHTVSDRLDIVAKAPELEVPVYSEFESEAAYNAYVAPRRGAPLPPTVLDLSAELDPQTLEADALSFVSSLDPEKNRYLRTTAELAELGVEKTPYA